MYSLSNLKDAIQLASEANDQQAVAQLRNAYNQMQEDETRKSTSRKIEASSEEGVKSAPTEEETQAALAQYEDPYDAIFNSDSNVEGDGFFTDVASGFGAGIVGMYESAALGAATVAEEETELKVRDKIKKTAEYFRPDSGDADSWTYKISAGLGSIAALFPAALAGPVAPLVALVVSGASGAGEASERARNFGATEEERNSALVKGIGVGMTEAIPLARMSKAFQLPWLNKLISKADPKDIEKISDRVVNAFKTGTAEGAQELAAAVMQNKIAQGYDPEQVLVDAGAYEEGAIGGASGAILQSVIDMFGRRGIKAPSGTVPPEKVDPDAPKFDDDPAAPAGIATVVNPDVGLTESQVAEATGGPEGVAEPTLLGANEETRLEELTGRAMAAGEDGAAPLTPEEQAEFESLFESVEGKPRGQMELDIPSAMGEETKEDRFAQARVDREQPPQEVQDDLFAEEEGPQQADLVDDIFAAERADNDVFDDAINSPQRDMFRSEPTQQSGEQDYITMQEKQASEQAELAGNEQAAQELADEEGKKLSDRQMTIDDSAMGQELADIDKADTDRRTKILQDTLSAGTETNPRKVAGAFKHRLKQAGLDPVVTPEEQARLDKGLAVTAAVKAEPTPEVAPESTPEDGINFLPFGFSDKPPLAPTQTELDVDGINFLPFGFSDKPPLAALPEESAVATGVKAGIAEQAAKPIAAKPVVTEPTISPEEQADIDENGFRYKPKQAPKKALTKEEVDSKFEEPKKPAAKPKVSTVEQAKKVAEVKAAKKAEVAKKAAETKKNKAAKVVKDAKVAAAKKTAEKTRQAAKAKKDAAAKRAANKKPVVAKKPAAPVKAKEKKPTPTKTTGKATDERSENRNNTSVPAPKGTPKNKKVSLASQLSKEAGKPKALKEQAETISGGKNDAFADTTPDTEPTGRMDSDYTNSLRNLPKLIQAQVEKIRLVIDNMDPNIDNVLMKALIEYRDRTANIESMLYQIAFDLNVEYERYDRAKGVPAFTKEALGKTGSKTAKEAVKALQQIEGVSDILGWISTVSAREQVALQATTERAKKREKAENERALDAQEQADADAEGLRYLSADAVSASTAALHPSVVNLLIGGDLKGALEIVAATVGNSEVAAVASALAKHMGDTTIEVLENLHGLRGTRVAGLFDPVDNKVQLDLDNGMSIHTLLHEVTHAATSAILANKSHPITKQLTDIYNKSKKHLESAYGTKSLDEFVAEAFSNPDFQTKLAMLRPDGETRGMFSRFAKTIGNMVRRWMGKPAVDYPTNAKTETDKLINSILSPAPSQRLAGQLLMESTPDGVQGILDREAADQNTGTITRKGLVSDIEGFITSTAPKVAKHIALGFASMPILADLAKKYGYGDIGYRLDVALLSRKEKLDSAEVRADTIVKKAMAMREKMTDREKEMVNALTYGNETGSTIHQIDPFMKEADALQEFGDDNERMRVWDNQQLLVKELEKNPVTLEYYKFLEESYKTEFARAKDAMERRIDSVGGDTGAANAAKKEITDLLTQLSELAQYAPLVRQGEYKLSYQLKRPARNSGAQLDEDAAAAIKNNRFVVRYFNSPLERDAAAKEVKADDTIDSNSVTTKDGNYEIEDFESMPPESFVRKTLDIVRKAGLADTVETDIMRMFIDMMPENSFQKSIQGRKNIKGFVKDTHVALQSKIYGLTRQAANYDSKQEIEAIKTDLDETLKSASSLTDKERAESEEAIAGEGIHNELSLRINFATKGATVPWFERFVRFGTQYAFLGTIGGNVSSVVANLSQLGVVIGPALSMKYGWQETMGEMSFALKLVTGSKKGSRAETKTAKALDAISPAHGVDAYYDITRDETTGDSIFTVRTDMDLSDEMVAELENIIPMVKLAKDRNLLNKSALVDALGVTEIERLEQGNKVNKIFNGIVSLSAGMFNQGERLNRQVTLLASYNLNLKKLMKDNDAAKGSQSYADMQVAAAEASFLETQELNGGNVLETAPRWAQQHIGRAALMYKTFGITMAYTQLKMARKASKSLFGKNPTAEEKEMGKVAMKQLTGIFGSSVFFSGVYGVPIYGALQMLWDMSMTDEDEDDFNTIVEQNLGEAWFRGGLNQILEAGGADIDVGVRTRLTDLIIQENRFNPDATTEETLAYVLGGVPFSMYKKNERGFADLKEIGVSKALESFLPTALANPYKLLNRYIPEHGIKTRRGDFIYGELSAGEIAAQLLGFPPADYLRQQEENRRAKGVDLYINTKASTLTKKYYVAVRNGDYDTMQSTRDEMDEFNSRNPAAAVTEESIMKSMKAHEKTSATMYNGVMLSPKYKKVMEWSNAGVESRFSPVDDYFNR